MAECDCCKGKFVPVEFWDENSDMVDCPGTVTKEGYCGVYTESEIKRYEEALEKQNKFLDKRLPNVNI